MNDFELRRELREMRLPREPQRDLWAQISRQLDDGPALSKQVAHRSWWPLAAAAGVALAVTAGLFSLTLQRQDDSQQAALSGLRDGPSVREQIERAHELANTGDPRLAGAEVVIDAASDELEQALQQHPDAVFLVGLINRTHAQRRKLARLGLNAG